MGTAGHLAVAARTHRRLLWVRAGFVGTRRSLAIATVEQRQYSNTKQMIAPLAKFIDWSVLQIGYATLPQSIWREPATIRSYVPSINNTFSLEIAGRAEVRFNGVLSSSSHAARRRSIAS